MDIAGKTAIVTGGASGLGEGTVRAYLDKGAKVAIFDLNTERGAALIEELGAERLAFFEGDVTDEDAVQSALNAVVDRFGALHICNNFAGIGLAIKTFGKHGPHPLDAYKKVININLIGSLNVARLAAEKMAANETIPTTSTAAKG